MELYDGQDNGGAPRQGNVPAADASPHGTGGSSGQLDGSESTVVEVHIVAASLIATITFGAIFQIPGGLDDNENSVQLGAARMALNGMFKLFLISDVIAFSASMAVLIVWLFRERLQKELNKGQFSGVYLSQLSLVVASIATIFAFLGATIVVVIPPNVHILAAQHKKEFEAYAQLWISVTMITLIPVVVSMCLVLTITPALWFAIVEVLSATKEVLSATAKVPAEISEAMVGIDSCEPRVSSEISEGRVPYERLGARVPSETFEAWVRFELCEDRVPSETSEARGQSGARVTLWQRWLKLIMFLMTFALGLCSLALCIVILIYSNNALQK